MNISSAGSGSQASYFDKSMVSTLGGVPSADLNSVTTVEALQKASLSGEHVTAGDEQVIKKLDKILTALQGPNTSLEMSMHKETKTVVIKVMNKETGELIREIPPEKTLDLVAKFMEINGILIDEKV
ncbi:flagellar protein FlaG [Cohnella ginsengisoli]|uniref:Flagellar protein FlaG n=1 Tax=Cohnella ginsengisoli TaxID=425004 RepID=A0A9X4QQG3_9BACL|nr:flagellar protein FlaG [Cohnella ginsengisoli]MDG0794572.1 flagellar protein FlaG [Cohnella ginsengisoli]